MEFTTLKTNLENLGYKVSCFDNAAEAASYLEGAISSTTVGIGGRMWFPLEKPRVY